ncbi:putative ribonuclease H-like domain-containing protein [Tanacetum coccineum]
MFFSTGRPALNNTDQDDSQIPTLEDIYDNPSDRIFTNASYDDEGAVADFTNLESTMNVSPITTLRIHSINPTTQILGDPKSAVQTKSKVHKSSGAHAFEELLQFKIQEVWILVDLPYEKKAIGTKWEEGIYYDEVFALVARIEAIRIFLAFASYMGFIFYQMDVKSSFLYGTIYEEVYVSQPPGFVDHKFPKKVYKVVKALYGLHQAPRAWYATLSTFLLKSRYRRGSIDKTLFIKKDKNDIMLVQVYVDVKQKEDGIFLSQDKYVAEILKKFDFASVKTASTLIETHKPLVKDEEAADVDAHLYRSMIGSLMYLTASRHDIMFAVCACSRFEVTPKTFHLNAVKRIFRYLKGKPKLGLWYPRVSLFNLEAYSDSDYVGANLDRKSATGGCQFLGRRLISWQCKKQTIIATSTTEAKDAYEKKLIQVLKIHTNDNVADLLTKAFDVSSLVNTARPNSTAIQFGLNPAQLTLSTTRLCWCCSKVFNYGVDAWIGSKMLFGLDLRFWNTTSSQTVNDEKQIHATVDSKAVVVTEASIRSSLLLHDADGTACLTNEAIFQNLALMGVGDQPHDTKSSSGPDNTHSPSINLKGTGGNEGGHVQLSNDSPHSGGNTSKRAEGGLNLEELLSLCTNLSNKVLALEIAKDAQAAKILKLKIRIKKLEQKCKPSISHYRACLKIVKRLSMKNRLGKKEPVSKQGRKNVKP